MRKLLIALTLTIAALTLSQPIGIGANANDFNYQVNPILVPVSPDTSFPNGIPLCRSNGIGVVCYSPNFIKKAYEFPSDAALDGRGQTIVVVDAFGSPTITSDLALFDARFGIPAPPSFTIFCGDSLKPYDITTCPHESINVNTGHHLAGWAYETTLDVEWAHATAPGANIVLDVASTSSGNAINAAEASAIAAYPGAIFSQSFGIPEALITANNGQVLQAERNYANGVALGDTFFASTGDTGATFGTSTPMANFPSSDVHNTGVTGTQGLPYIEVGTLLPCFSSDPFSCTTGLSTFHGPCVLGRVIPPDCIPDGYGGEQVWNEPNFGATGGAQSLLFGVPSYQNGLGLTARGPDVAYDAAVDGAVLVVYSFLGPTFFGLGGGTSAGSPQWAGIAALANQARANLGKGSIGGNLNTALYSIYHSARYSVDFHDITIGNNQLVGTPVGYAAGPGYDLASGIGSPIVDQLIQDIAAS